MTRFPFFPPQYLVQFKDGSFDWEEFTPLISALYSSPRVDPLR